MTTWQVGRPRSQIKKDELDTSTYGNFFNKLRWIYSGNELMSQNRNSDQHLLFTPFQRFLGSRLVTGIGMFLSGRVPRFIGYGVARLIAEMINWLRPEVYWILHANLSQVVGPDVEEKKLHQLVRQGFRNNARNDYDLWRLMNRGKEALRTAVHIPAEGWTYIEQALQRGKGLIFVGTHTGNFDLSILSLAAQGLDIQVLGLADPPAGGFDLMERMRASAGVHSTATGLQALREAIGRLRDGGIVLTGVDRPVRGRDYPVKFFGRLAPLPIGHVRLALKTDAAIIVAGPYHDPQRGNMVRFSPPIEMTRTGDRYNDLQLNLQHVTDWLEEFIHALPEQWALFIPVWPGDRDESV